ncbi:hypothetical protein IS481_10895 [Caldimonas thermodepolymerans]|jgi:hypothetical protein|uniref:Uncharacterized protein n=2 Tax=Caldimonas thermodepolymerans TaxID=215580 RepID=A0A2S5T5W4_9BURK|nr:hypothetical protein [Caldimonas thermodepolymerans]PPE70395.1 hypothetical protein C1702_06860 [Caldimonas thermodepolymerans]QPC30302.1 hypothetical protein IS481_10895 [Caldimonas thermodepolymerans]RDI00698.1 hypothetical protein DES46_104265 [Caldimonas thermodepolymerans]UZG46729.1 hypothetical protein ONS87_12245 [Caldimonas thermodepolymerans]
MAAAVAVVAVAGMTACTTTPRSSAPVVDLAQALDEATAAQQQGDVAKALSLLDAAARAHPGSKQPWLKTAQIHFDVMNYGAAIVAAQEVLQRDTSDVTARSILAVSGLRVSADALARLRQANAVSGSTRSEAESLARLIRDALGEPVLVPTPAAAMPGHAAAGERPHAGRAGGASERRGQRAVRSTPLPAAPAFGGGGRHPFEALQ